MITSKFPNLPKVPLELPEEQDVIDYLTALRRRLIDELTIVRKTLERADTTSQVVAEEYEPDEIVGYSLSKKRIESTGYTVASFAPADHHILSATHGDTTAAAVVRGDIITGQGATPVWARLAKGAQYTILSMGADEPAWATRASLFGSGTDNYIPKFVVGATPTFGDSLLGPDDGTTLVFNEAGAAKDFRMEGDTDANLFFLDGSADKIGFGTNAPAGAKLDVVNSGGFTGGLRSTNNATNGRGALFYATGSGGLAVYASGAKYAGYFTATTEYGLWVDCLLGMGAYIIQPGTLTTNNPHPVLSLDRGNRGSYDYSGPILKCTDGTTSSGAGYQYYKYSAALSGSNVLLSYSSLNDGRSFRYAMYGYDTTASAWRSWFLDTTSNSKFQLNYNNGTVIAQFNDSTSFQYNSLDAATNAVVNNFIIGHDTSGTPAAGFGAGILGQLESSTTASQDAAQIAWSWTDATHATRTSNIKFSTVLSAGALTERFAITGTEVVVNDPGTDAYDFRVETDDEANMILSDGDANILYLGGTTNGVKIEQGGNLTLIGTATQWEDLRIEPVARTTGSNAPTFEKWYDDAAGTSRGVYLYSFDDAAGGSEKEVFFSMQMPHAWAGTAISMHIHWVGAVDDTTADPRWGLEYIWKDIGEVYGDTTIVYSDGTHITTAGADANVTAHKHYLTEFADITPGATADGLSSILIGRLFRDSAAAGDTYNATGAKVGLLYIDAHYEVSSLGSKEEYVK